MATSAHHRSRMRTLDLMDMQAGGDVSRVVLGGVDPLPGGSVREQSRYLSQHADGLRRLLLSEPYGDPAMSVNLVVPASDPDAQAGYIIMEAMGYPLYSGSNTICTATAVLESGRIPMHDGEQEVVLESPAGPAHVTARNRDGTCGAVTTRGEPAYVAARDLEVTVPRYGTVPYDVVWSGELFAMVRADRLGFALVRDEMPQLAAFGDAFVRAVREQFRPDHPVLGEVGPVPFAHFMGPVERAGDDGFEARSATYVHPGVICRSPTGTGTSARLALMAEHGEIAAHQWLDAISPRDSRFRGTVLGGATVGDKQALDSHITAEAWVLAHARVMVDLDDPLVDATDLQHILSTPHSGTS